LVAIALLKKEQSVPVPAAVAAVGVTALLEALVFALFLVAVMFVGATQWEQLIGPEKAQQVLMVLLACCVFAIGFAVVAIVLAKKRRKVQQGAPLGGLKALVRKTLEESGATLGAGRFVALNLGLAAIQVGLVVGCFLALLPTVGINLDPHMPVLAVSGVIAFGARSIGRFFLRVFRGQPGPSAGFCGDVLDRQHSACTDFRRRAPTPPNSAIRRH
jgi:hypothetical protein